MLEYIKNQLVMVEELPVHNILFHILADSSLRNKVTFNTDSDHFEFPIAELSHTDIKVLEMSKIGYYVQNLKGTEIFMQIWNDKISFWLQK